MDKNNKEETVKKVALLYAVPKKLLSNETADKMCNQFCKSISGTYKLAGIDIAFETDKSSMCECDINGQRVCKEVL